MLYNSSFYKDNDIDNKNILNNYFNPYEYNLESNIKDKPLKNIVKSEAHLERNRIKNKK